MSNTSNPVNAETANGNSGWALVAEGDWLAGQRFALTKDKIILGRDVSCDITIPGTHLSRRHAELEIRGHKILIKDLNSANGTFYQQQRINQIELQAGDVVRFDVLNFRIHGPAATDANATIIRQMPTAKPKPSTVPPENKNWKTKPTSVGNREEPYRLSTKQLRIRQIGFAVGIIMSALLIAGIGFLITQL